MKFWQHIFTITALAIISFASQAQTNISAPALPKFEVRAYQFEGNTFLPPEKLSETLSNFTGAVDLNRIHAGLIRLQNIYRASGYTNVSVTLPRQTLTDGIVRVQIISHAPAGVTNVVAKPPTVLLVNKYRIEGNSVLPPQDFGVLSNYTGTNITVPELREGLGKVQLRYRELGFPTISVTLPPQRITNGTVKVKIIEGRLNAIRITGNEHFSTNNIRRALPGLTTNILLNTKWFQPELDRANANKDRQIYPVISPGPEPGTSDLTLQVKDRLPLHGRVEVNDKSTPGTALLRTDVSVQYDNLWQLEHAIGVDYNFTPQEFKPANEPPTFADYPQVSSASAFYRIPLGSGGNLREEAKRKPVTFGYDEVSHKFNLPPPSGHPELTLYASHSSSDSHLQYGQVKTIFTNTLADIYSQFVQHMPSANDNFGAKLTVPLDEFAGVKSTLIFGADFKSYAANMLATNLTYFSLYALDPYGNRVLVTNETVRLSANSSQRLFYIPLSFGWLAYRPDKTGAFQFTFNQAVFLSALGSARTNFQIAAGNVHAGGDYTTINAGLVRQQNLPGGWMLVGNVNGQWASAPLISNEQFGIGGTAGVRGYREGEVYGDSGWRGLLDLRAPAFNIGYFPTATGEIPALLRCSIFTDYGQVYFLDRAGQPSVNEWGAGLGFFLTVGEHFDARLTLAWALLGDSPKAGATTVATQTVAGNAQAYFNVGYQF